MACVRALLLSGAVCAKPADASNRYSKRKSKAEQTFLERKHDTSPCYNINVCRRNRLHRYIYAAIGADRTLVQHNRFGTSAVPATLIQSKHQTRRVLKETRNQTTS